MSRPITIEELRRVLFALRDSAADAAATGARHDRSLFACDIAAALAALPAEQEPLRHGPEQGCAQGFVVSHPIGDPDGLWVGREPQPASSAVPELPPTMQASTVFDNWVLRCDYDALRTAAESLRERLGEALRERDAGSGRFARLDSLHAGYWKERCEQAEAKAAVCGGEWCAQNRAEGRGGCGACAWCCQQATARAEQAEQEREEARALAWEQAQRTLTEWEQCRVDCGEALLDCGEALVARDAAIARAAKAEQRLREVEQERSDSFQQAPFAWTWIEDGTMHEGSWRRWSRKSGDAPPGATALYAAPPSAAAARREALLEVAQRFEAWPVVSAWCRERAEEVQR